MRISRLLVLEALLLEKRCPNCSSNQIEFSPQSTGWEVKFKCHHCGWWDTVTWVEIDECGGKLPK